MNNSNNIPKGHFVFFGPVNAGKSSMIGYIKTHDLSDVDFIKEVDKIKARIGQYYKQCRLLSYFVDTAKDEYEKSSDVDHGNQHGTSKYVHIKDAGGYVLVDTPGGSRYVNQRYKGLSLANIGVFTIEIKQLLKLNNYVRSGNSKDMVEMKEFFGSWFVWQKLHGTNNSIILLTKYDLCNGRDDFETAKKMLLSIIGGDRDLTIIPTSISNEHRNDTNVFTPITGSWYKGKTLIQAIEEKNTSMLCNETNNELLMFYNKEYDRPILGAGKIIKWKVNCGSIKIGDKITIAPVLIDKKYSIVMASIKSMQNEKKETISCAFAGEIVNTALSNIVYENKSLPKESIDIFNTSVISTSTSIFKMGDSIMGYIDLNNCTEAEMVVLNAIKMTKLINLLWFGKMLVAFIISCEKEQDEHKAILTLKLENGQVALPNNFLPKKMLVQFASIEKSELPINFDYIVTDIFETM